MIGEVAGVRTGAMSAMVALGSAALGVALSCNSPVFNCLTDDDCRSGGGSGTCQPSSYCSVDDSTCASGQRYVELAAENLAGQCVPGDDPGSTETGTGDGATFTPLETSPSSGGASVTSMPITSGVESTSTTFPPAESSSSSSSSGDPEGSSSTGTIDHSLVLWLSFDSDDIGLDSSPQAFPTDCPQAQCPVHVDGVSGRAGSFADSPMTVPDFTDIEINAFTVSYWARVPAFAFMGVVALPIGTEVDNSFESYVRPQEMGLLFAMQPLPFSLFVAPVEANTWVHMTATWDGDVFSVYKDGELFGSEPNTEYFADTLPLVVGGDIDNGEFNNSLSGDIDELRIYDRALSAEEIASLFENPGG